MDFSLGETADMLRETVRGFASSHVAPRAESIDRENTFPRDLWPKLGELGLFGVDLVHVAHRVVVSFGPDLMEFSVHQIGGNEFAGFD